MHFDIIKTPFRPVINIAFLFSLITDLSSHMVLNQSYNIEFITFRYSWTWLLVQLYTPRIIVRLYFSDCIIYHLFIQLFLTASEITYFIIICYFYK